jgi:hypothetical protein
VLTFGFTMLFTALSVLCAAYVVKAVQFYRARASERRKLGSTPSGKLHPTDPQSRAGGEGRGGGAAGEGGPEEMLELELLVRTTSSPPWWLAFQVTYILSMIMMAVSSIHVVVRAMDDLTILVFRNTYGLQLSPEARSQTGSQTDAHLTSWTRFVWT